MFEAATIREHMKPPARRLAAVASLGAILLGGAACGNDTPEKPPFPCTIFTTTAYEGGVDASVQVDSGVQWGQDVLGYPVRVTFNDRQSDKATSDVIDTQLYTNFNHQFVNVSGVTNRMEATVTPPPESSWAEGHCSSAFEFTGVPAWDPVPGKK